MQSRYDNNAQPRAFHGDERPPSSHAISSATAMELERTIGLSASVSNALCLHPSKQAYVHPAGGSIVVSQVHNTHHQTSLRGHEGVISCLAMSPSGRLLASGERGRNADVIVWDYASQQELVRLSEHDHGIAAVAFSDDDRLLCSIGNSDDARLFVWDLGTGQICATQPKCTGIVTSVAFGGMARDVKHRETSWYQFAVCGHRLLVLHALNPQTGELSAVNMEQTTVRDFTCLAFSKDRETLVAGTSSGDFAVVHVPTKRCLHNVPACSGGIGSLAFLENGGLLVGGGDARVLLFSPEFVAVSAATCDAAIVGIAVAVPPSNAPTQSSQWDAVGPRPPIEAVVATQAGSIFCLYFGSPQQQKQLQPQQHKQLQPQQSWPQIQVALLCANHANAVVDVAYAAEVSDRFATISTDQTIRIWDASDYSAATTCVVLDAGSPTALQFSLDVLLSAWSAGCIRCHRADSGDPLWAIDPAHTGGVSALVLSHNQRFLVSAGVHGEVRVWDIRKRDMVAHLKEHSMTVTGLALFGDDQHVVSCSRDRSVLCWDLRTERRISSHVQRMGGIDTIALGANERLVLTAGQDKRISFWDLRIDMPVHVVEKAHDEEVTCVAVGHSLGVFATGSSDRMVKLWNFNTGTLLVNGMGHSGAVRSVAFSPDDRQLVSVGDDGCVLVWNVFTAS